MWNGYSVKRGESSGNWDLQEGEKLDQIQQLSGHLLITWTRANFLFKRKGNYILSLRAVFN